MCDQTEIEYLDGDVVWVKLGPCWWPGQVTAFSNLPDDVQKEFQNKPLIAAVKFFQEDSYEYVKSYHQIYKYNCIQKDEFIRKGLDKYRNKSKDGSTIMDKFPGDVETAEKLTEGDPDILSHEKFNPEEKPDISSLFGEKKPPKKKRNREESFRKSHGGEISRKITHPRFLHESDHEVRIRLQPSSMPSTPNNSSSTGEYPCHLCNFTTSRVNVIIRHIRSHSFTESSSSVKSRIKSYTQSKNKLSGANTPKRKYVRKDKSQLNKSKGESSGESTKRKQTKQNDKANKKKKMDPEIRDTLLADWEDESDEDVPLTLNKDNNQNSNFDSSVSFTTDTQINSSIEESRDEQDISIKDTTDSKNILEETEKLLRDTENLTKIVTSKNDLATSTPKSAFKVSEIADEEMESSSTMTSPLKQDKEADVKLEEMKTTEDKKSRLSCFDFDEEDPEPTIPHVRKIPRLGGKLKKEIIKEYEMNQALKNEKEKNFEEEKSATFHDKLKKFSFRSCHDIDSNENKNFDIEMAEKPVETITEGVTKDQQKDEYSSRKELPQTKVSAVKEDSPVKTSVMKELTPTKLIVPPTEKLQNQSSISGELLSLKKDSQKVAANETEVEIVEILEFEPEDDIVNFRKGTERGTQPVSAPSGKSENLLDDKNNDKCIENPKEDIEHHMLRNSADKELRCETNGKSVLAVKESNDVVSKSNLKDDTINDSVKISTSITDKNIDIPSIGDVVQTQSFTGEIKKRRGRPRKSSQNATVLSNIDSGESNKTIEIERKLSESDSERSFSGRRRKPNKKYIQSDTYISSPEHRAFKTDESQSESDDMLLEQPKVKSRRGRKPGSPSKKYVETLQQNVEIKLAKDNLTEVINNVDSFLNKAEVKIDRKSLLDEDSAQSRHAMTLEEERLVVETVEPICTSPTNVPPLNVAEEQATTISSKNNMEELFLSKDAKVEDSVNDKIITTKDVIESSCFTSIKMSNIIVDEEMTPLYESTTESSLPKDIKLKNTVDKKEEVLPENNILNIVTTEDVKKTQMNASDVKSESLEIKKNQQQSFESTTIDILPPKKSQIKKFEQSQLDSLEHTLVCQTNITENKEEEKEVVQEMEPHVTETKLVAPLIDNVSEDALKTGSVNVDIPQISEREKVGDGAKDSNICQESIMSSKSVVEQDSFKNVMENKCEKIHEELLRNEPKTNNINKETDAADSVKFSIEEVAQNSPLKTRYKGKFTPNVDVKFENEVLEEKSINTFQEAFLQTLNTENDGKTDDTDSTVTSNTLKEVMKKNSETDTTIVSASSTKIELKSLDEKVSENPAVRDKIKTNLENVEAVVAEPLKSEKQTTEDSLNITAESAEIQSVTETASTNMLTLDMLKPEESTASTPSPSSDVSVPVKKREKPRIIENVALKEPMILKAKLLEKVPLKGLKHKLDVEQGKREGTKGKIMKLESSSSNIKARSAVKTSVQQHAPMKQNLQVLQVTDAETQKDKVKSNQILTNISTSISTTPLSEKCIQQSSQSLEDMELDINSMPFVLSEDVLTPESIEQMPVVISTIPIPSSAMSTTLTMPTTTTATEQTFTLKQTQHKVVSEAIHTKKKSETPAILKSKTKPKPTITSIKTIVPPLTGGVKGLKFQNTQSAKATGTLVNQTPSTGKYVIVHTANNQQIRYSVQGRVSTSQKLHTSTNKSSSSAQIVQQGNKVVILTSPQSGQARMLPLNVSKNVGGKLQRIVTNKGQVYTSLNPQSVVAPKTIVAKSDAGTPTTSKIPQGQKILISSKSSTLLGTVGPQGIIKSGIYTPITTSTVTAKQAVISPKKKGNTYLTQQTIGTSKGTIVSPITQAVSSKFVATSKGTVLTPITGQQVKAIAAKSPAKPTKVQYQSKMQQVPLLQKTQKTTSMTPTQTKLVANVKAGTTLLYQTPVTSFEQKSTTSGKKVKQVIVQQSVPMPSLTALNNSQSVNIVSHTQQKGKMVATSATPQKLILPRSRQNRVQQKIMAKETVQNVQSSKIPVTSVDLSNIPPLVPKSTLPKQSVAAVVGSKSARSQVHSMKPSTEQHKNVLNTDLNQVLVSSPGIESTMQNIASSVELDNQKITKLSTAEQSIPERVVMEEPKASQTEETKVEKTVEEAKITAQPQLIAVPIENSDGGYCIMAMDEHGQYQHIENNALIWEGLAQNADGSRTLYIDPGESMSLENVVLQFPSDNGVLTTLQTSVNEPVQTTVSESYPSSEIVQTSNQDILAAALANTDFQQEIGLPETPAASVMSTSLTQTSLINQTILQSTIIPPTEHISSPLVLETSLTLNQPIMTPLEVPSSLPIQSETTTSVPAVSTVPPSSLELPITITNPSISYITAGDAQMQIAGNSMPDIGEIMQASGSANSITGDATQIEIPESTQYIVIPANLEENMTLEQSQTDNKAIPPTVSYSVSIPENIIIQTTQVQTTPSMPIIDDTYTEDMRFNDTVEAATSVEQNFADVPVSEMLVSKATTITENSTVQSTVAAISSVEDSNVIPSDTQDNAVTSQKIHVTAEEEAEPSQVEEEAMIPQEKEIPATANMPSLEEPCISSDSNTEVQSTDQVSFVIMDSNEAQNDSSHEAEALNKLDESFRKLPISDSSTMVKEQAATSNQDDFVQEQSELPIAASKEHHTDEDMDIEETVEMAISEKIGDSVDDSQRAESSSQAKSDMTMDDSEVQLDGSVMETGQEAPSQSYEQFDMVEVPSQSAKSENSREPSQSVQYETMETDDSAMLGEPPTQSFEDAKHAEATRSAYKVTSEINANAPTQSFNEIMQCQENRTSLDEGGDDPSFPTQSYEVEKMESLTDSLETDPELSQEGNIPSQSNDIGSDGIGTSSLSTNNSTLNEDETASSSYVPETPENQERDQDQESAISTSSYEIPPCEELNIASSSVIPDTSVREEHSSIHDNGVPEIPTSSYNLNPDSSSTHVDSVPTSSYEDQIIVEQNVSTSYEVAISMPALEDASSQNLVTESSDHRNEPTSYYPHHQEVTASYYESAHDESNSRLEGSDIQEEVTASYYESTARNEASQSYLSPEEATPSYCAQNMSPTYYEPRPESEASQSFYPTSDLEHSEQSTMQNVEASQSFYQENVGEQRLRQRDGEATPTYTDRYPTNYVSAASTMDRHDLVESSVPATTRHMER